MSGMDVGGFCRRRRWPWGAVCLGLVWLVVTGCSGGGVGVEPDAADAAPDVWDAAPDVWDAAPDVRDAAPPADILEQLEAVEGMTVIEGDSSGGYRFFELWYEQPVDHDDLSGPTFTQYMTLMHRSTSVPMTLVTAGYFNYWQDYLLEPTVMFSTNQLVVEHRYFGQSVPQPTDWQYLTIAQAAADHHRVFEALKPIYPAAWVSTGASKGGMTASYYRRFYPDDVDGTVAYVAPLSLGAPDARYVGFLESVGTQGCRDALHQVQIEALNRRAAMIPLANATAAVNGYTFDHLGGIDVAVEGLVINLPFTFWQYSGVSDCSQIPGTGATDQVIWQFVESHTGLDWAADEHAAEFGAYYYQARSQLGYPDVATDWLDALLITDASNLEVGQLPQGAPEPTFDPAAMVDIADWVATSGDGLMFVYGEYDPWTGGAYDLGAATDSYLYMVPQATHYADIGALPWSEQSEALDILAGWYGVSPKPAEQRAPLPFGWQRLARDPRFRRLLSWRLRGGSARSRRR